MPLCSFLLRMLLWQWLVWILKVEISKWTYLIMSDIITHHTTLPIDGKETWTAFQFDCTLKQSDSGHSTICVVTTHIISMQTSYVWYPLCIKSKIKPELYKSTAQEPAWNGVLRSQTEAQALMWMCHHTHPGP